MAGKSLPLNKIHGYPHKQIPVGTRLTKLLIVGEPREIKIKNRIGWNYYYPCLCDCGNSKEILSGSLIKGLTKSCGCLSKEIARTKDHHEELTGRRFGRLVVIKYLKAPNDKSRWLCMCDCGNNAQIRACALKNGKTKSCGCLKYRFSETHGKHRIPEYAVWCAMKQRCNNTSAKSYKNYGGRGIKVCNRWQQFENFIADMGERPSPEYSLERVDNDGNYSPENCKWATRKEQNNNNRHNHMITFNNETLCLKEWAEKIGIDQCTLIHRLKVWTIEKALTQPNRLRRKR